jgi:hypothetical protein
MVYIKNFLVSDHLILEAWKTVNFIFNFTDKTYSSDLNPILKREQIAD